MNNELPNQLTNPDTNPEMTSEPTKEKEIGRNEPCPCKSGKKYKRCCGVNAAPKLTPPKQASPFSAMANSMASQMGQPMVPGSTEQGSSGTPSPSDLLAGIDPQWMNQFTQSLQRLPKGQLQRMQALMQKAMSGKDITKDAAEFEKTLPLEFQQMMRNFQVPEALKAQMGGNLPIEASSAPVPDSSSPEMSVEDAQKIVEEAMKEGKISKEEGETLLQQPEPSKGIGKFWKNLTGKK